MATAPRALCRYSLFPACMAMGVDMQVSWTKYNTGQSAFSVRSVRIYLFQLMLSIKLQPCSCLPQLHVQYTVKSISSILLAQI